MATAEVERPRVLYKRPIDFPPLVLNEIPYNVRQLRKYVYGTAITRGDLRRGQVEALEETVKAFEKGERVGYVEQVSGYGKSRYMEEVGKGFGGRIVYITPGETGSTNIVNKYDGRGIGRIDKNHKEIGREITVITMQSLQGLHRALQKGDVSRLDEARFIFGADLIFADELHHYLTDGRALPILSTFLYLNPRSFMVGASATAGYDKIKHAEQQFGKPLHRVDIVEGVEEEVLISPHVRYIKTGVTLDGLRLTPEGDFVIDGKVPLKEWDKKLLETYLQTCEEEGKQLRTISYLSNVDRAFQFAELAQSMGVPSEVIIGSTKNREQIYDRLEQGKLGTVVTVNTAIESLDLPWLEGTLHSAQTRSTRVARQMFPRSMRNFPGKKEPWIIQAIADNTSYKRRPILASDILGETLFLNGSIVRPKRPNESPKYNVQNSAPRTTRILPEGAEVNIEVIDIHSLFRMGILDKAELIGKGLLPSTEVDKFRTEIKDFLNRVYKENPSHGFSHSYMPGFYDEIAQESLSFPRIISHIFGIQASNLQGVHSGAFKVFLETGKLPKEGQVEEFVKSQTVGDYFGTNGLLEKNERVEPDEQETQRVEFMKLCDEFKNGKLSHEEIKQLSISVYEMLRGIDTSKFRASTVFGPTQINNSLFNGTVLRLSAHLGLNTVYGKGTYGNTKGSYTYASHVSLLEFADKYAEEEKLSNRALRKYKRLEVGAQLSFAQSNRNSNEFSGMSSDLSDENKLLRRNFINLCLGFRNGELMDDQKKQLALKVNEILEKLDVHKSEPPALFGVRRVAIPEFDGRIETLSRLLGFSKGSFSVVSRNLLHEFTNSYSKYDEVEPENSLGELPNQTDQRVEKLTRWQNGVREFITDPPGIGEERLWKILCHKYGVPRNGEEARQLKIKRDNLLNWMEDRYLPELERLKRELDTQMLEKVDYSRKIDSVVPKADQKPAHKQDPRQYEMQISLLRDVFREAEQGGFNIKSIKEMSGYSINDDRFSGTINLLAKNLGVKNKASHLRASELITLREIAGIQD